MHDAIPSPAHRVGHAEDAWTVVPQALGELVRKLAPPDGLATSAIAHWIACLQDNGNGGTSAAAAPAAAAAAAVDNALSEGRMHINRS